MEPLEPMILHEWLWDSLQSRTNTDKDLQTLSEPLKEYVSVWSVRNYIGNGGIDAPLLSVPNLLPYAKKGYLAINCPVAAEAVSRLIDAMKFVLDVNEHIIEKADLSTLIYELTEENSEKMDNIITPGGLEVGFEEFDVPELLAEFVRSNYEYFIDCELPVEPG